MFDDLLVVSDIGVDDAIALVLIDKLLGPKSQKTLIPTFGNCTYEVTHKNAKEFIAGRAGWALAQGALHPAGSKELTFNAEDFHGKDGLWGVRPPQLNGDISTKDNLDDSSMLSLGPLTFPSKYLNTGNLHQIWLMGGNFDSSRPPEPNIKMDISSAKSFFESCKDVEVWVIPYNVSRAVRWSREDITKMPSSDNTTAWLKDLMAAWFENCNYETFALHDPVAAILAVHPEYALWEEAGVSVDENGNTYSSNQNPPCKIAQKIKDPEFLAAEIAKIIFQ